MSISCQQLSSSGRARQRPASSAPPRNALFAFKTVKTSFYLDNIMDLQPSSKICVNMSNGKRELEKEKSISSVSGDSSTNSSTGANGGGGGDGEGASAGSSGNTSKLSKIGRRLRDSCRNLRGKSAPAPRHNPEEYTSIQAPNESTRSRHYVAMDFTGKVGRIVDNKDLIRGYTSKDGYAYFRRKVSPKEVEPLLTESQAKVHTLKPWFHKGIGRDLAQRILATHNVDGAFLVRESSVSGGFVISYVCGGRTFHAQALPDASDEGVFYSLDDGKTKFFDLLQMVEFYQLNKGTLNSKLTHYIVRGDCPRAESPTSRSEVSTGQASEASMESQTATSSCYEAKERGDEEGKTDTNHNCQQSLAEMTEAAVAATAAAEEVPQAKEEEAAENSAASLQDAAMASEGDSDSLREFQQG